MLSFLPAVLEPMVRGGQITPISLGCSPARVYRISGAAAAPDCFLKIDIPRPRGLEREAAACFWLRGRFPAPEVLYYGESDGDVYLLTTALPGEGACFGDGARDPAGTARLLARTLDALHRLDAAECPLRNAAADLLSYARVRIRPSLPEEERPPEELFRELEAAPPPDGSVFCHGDFCLPNVLCEKGALTGLVDLGDAGAGNRHLDLAACRRSLQRHFGEERHVDLFLDEYGRDRVDPAQLAWFDRLETFF